MPNFCTLKSLSKVRAHARRHMPNFYEMGPKLLSFSLLSELNYNVFKMLQRYFNHLNIEHGLDSNGKPIMGTENLG